MIVKKYIVNNMNEAMNRIRYELGKDAVIISQRKVRRPGIKGLFTSKVIEVTAAVDNLDNNINLDKDQIRNSINEFKKAITNTTLKDKKVEKHIEPEKDDILKEMHEMKEMISKIAKDPNGVEDKSETQIKLENMGIKDNIIKEILDNVESIQGDLTKEEKIKKAIMDRVDILDVKLKGAVVLVGPTGVGKTTTIAKLAGRLALIEKKKVGLITVDTYRIGAIEQLSTYANIMNIPFKTVFSSKEMESALESMKECDVILIDTTGRSSKNVMQIAELNAYIQKVDTSNIHLVISCATKNEDIDAIIEGYKVLKFNGVIITKLDETTTYGSILNILDSAKKPLSFVTTGQNVPDDFKNITPKEVSELLLGEDNIC